MKQGWEIKKLGEVAEYFNGLTYSPKDVSDNGTIVLRSSNIQNDELDFSDIVRVNVDIKEKLFLKEGDILMCSRNGSQRLVGKTAPILNLPEPMTFGTFMMIIRSEFSPYLLWFFKTDEFKKQISGGENTMINQVTRYMLDEIKIPLPPLPEQQRIVSILDEAFAAIAKAKANAEQNLKNAKELFESYLQGVFENKGDGWEVTHLSEVCDFENGDRGKNYPNKSHRVSSGIPFINAGHLNENRLDFSYMDYISEERFNMLGNGKIKPNDILFCLRGSLGKVANVGNLDKGAIASSLVILRVKNELDNDFLLYFLNSNLTKKQIVDFGNGAAQPNLSAASLKKFIIPFPKSKEEQQTIVRQLDALRAETQKLEALYQKKIDDLEELKKSILQKAFEGELSSTSSSNITKVIPLQKIQGVSPTDLQAGITAIALQSHSELNKQDAFGHVKAEKIIHLAEYILNIDLERNPIKDAAGPNDFKHSKKVESRAAKAGFYTVAKRASDQDTGYTYTQGRSIESLIKKTQHCLGERNEVLSQLLKLIVPMKTQQAEIVATAYAAWNNLILKSVEFTDEDIVTEARENWREEKLKIPREKFFNAIEWMRKNEILIPKGNGRIVEAK